MRPLRPYLWEAVHVTDIFQKPQEMKQPLLDLSFLQCQSIVSPTTAAIGTDVVQNTCPSDSRLFSRYFMQEIVTQIRYKCPDKSGEGGPALRRANMKNELLGLRKYLEGGSQTPYSQMSS